MAENLENMMLEHLRAIRASQDHIEFEVKEVKTRITHLEQAVLGGSRATPLQGGCTLHRKYTS